MRSALSCLPACRYVPKHAAPREPLAPQTRSALAVGLTAAMLPLGAGTALADEPDGASASGTSATATVTTTPALTTPAVAPVKAKVAAAPQKVRSATSLSFSAPAAAKAKSVPVDIQLLADGRAVKDGYVRLERSTSKGWTYVGRLLTGADGVGKGTLKVAGSAKLRAAYTGSDVRTPAVSAPVTVTAAAASSGQAVIDEAAKHVGKPYVYGAVGPNAFDCSGFTRYVYAKVTGKSLPHNARAQERVTTPVSKADGQPGDLVFMQDVSGHVGIYAGGGRMYDAPRSGKNVSLRAIWSSNYTLGRVS